MNDRDKALLQEILQYCEKIELRKARFSIEKDIFVSDEAMTDLLLMPVFQIGELSGSLSEEFVTASDIPWHAIRGFRNVIAHDYAVVDPFWAWDTIESDIPRLKAMVETALSESR